MPKTTSEWEKDRKADAWVPYIPPQEMPVYMGGTIPKRVPTQEFFDEIHEAQDQYEHPEALKSNMEGMYLNNNGELIEDHDPRVVASKREAAARKRKVH